MDKGNEPRQIFTLQELFQDKKEGWFQLVENLTQKEPELVENGWRYLEAQWREVNEGRPRIKGGLPALAIAWARQSSELLTATLRAATKDLWELRDETVKASIFRLIDVYANVFTFTGFPNALLLPTLRAHLNYRTQGADLSKKEYKRPLSDIEMQKMFQKKFLRTKEIALLFHVRPRQIQRWVKEGSLKKHGPSGTFLRDDYLAFAKESVKYGEVVSAFNKMKKQNKGGRI
jgi:hypothetical protein